METDLAIEDFTEAGYANLLCAAKRRFRFIGLDSSSDTAGVAIWRHDIDMSPHRAVRMAGIEAAAGLKSIYFVMFGSRFYNPCEPVVTSLLQKIASFGHTVGLHFDAGAYEGGIDALESALRKEAELLSILLGERVTSFSVHNPTGRGGATLSGLNHAGLVNASSPALVNNFSYCSDSNGVWRHRRLMDVVNDTTVERLYALTHPEWWTPEAMRPRDRVQRCIDGRARQVGLDYDVDVAMYGRPNL